MKSFIQYFICLWMKLLNSVVNRNAYKKISDSANNDTDEAEKKILLSHLRKYHRSRPFGPTPSICYAPSKSVYFGIGGKVVPCCFNRDYVYGTYPQKNIADILSGEKRRDLQFILINQDFSKGCRHCRSQIIAGNYQGVEARLYDKLKKNQGFPSEMIFELDNTCNLECEMCNGKFSSSILKNRENSPIISSPYESGFFEQIKPYLKKLRVAKFLGGEPFLINSYYEIWAELIKHNPKCIINLQTNGTIYNQKIEDLLKRGRFQIGVSIDSLDANRFEKIRKKATLSQVLENLDKFIKYTRKNGNFVNISVCPMQQNWDEIPDLVNFCNKKNVFIYFNTVYTEGFNLQEFDAVQLKKVIEYYNKANVSMRTYISRRNVRFFKDLIHQINEWYNIKIEPQKIYVPRWEYSHKKILSVFKQKLGSGLSHQNELMIKESLKVLPSKIMINDVQKGLLDNLKAEDILNSLKNESVDQVKQRFTNFMNNSKFSL